MWTIYSPDEFVTETLVPPLGGLCSNVWGRLWAISSHESYIMQRESRCVGPVAQQPLNSRLLPVLPTLVVIWATCQDIEHLLGEAFSRSFCV